MQHTPRQLPIAAVALSATRDWDRGGRRDLRCRMAHHLPTPFSTGMRRSPRTLTGDGTGAGLPAADMQQRLQPLPIGRSLHCCRPAASVQLALRGHIEARVPSEAVVDSRNDDLPWHDASATVAAHAAGSISAIVDAD